VPPPANGYEAHGAPGRRHGVAGTGLLAVWVRVRSPDEDELNRWYAAEPLPELLCTCAPVHLSRRLAGLSITRYLAVEATRGPQPRQRPVRRPFEQQEVGHAERPQDRPGRGRHIPT
jgi:hypothetical protein